MGELGVHAPACLGLSHSKGILLHAVACGLFFVCAEALLHNSRADTQGLRKEGCLQKSNSLRHLPQGYFCHNNPHVMRLSYDFLTSFFCWGVSSVGKEYWHCQSVLSGNRLFSLGKRGKRRWDSEREGILLRAWGQLGLDSDDHRWPWEGEVDMYWGARLEKARRLLVGVLWDRIGVWTQTHPFQSRLYFPSLILKFWQNIVQSWTLISAGPWECKEGCVTSLELIGQGEGRAPVQGYCSRRFSQGLLKGWNKETGRT